MPVPRALRAAAKLWYVKMLSDQQSVPVPLDSQVIASGAADPDRVLVIGNGPTHGWGCITHELALTGQLARTLTRRSARPTDVRLVGAEIMNLAATFAWLGDQPLRGFDLVLLVLSMNDALRLTPTESYRADMRRLLEKLDTETDPSTRIIVAGIHQVASLPHYRGLLGRLGQRSADRLNAATRDVIGSFDRMRFLDLVAPEPEPDRPYGSPGLYAAWSERFAPACSEALDLARAERGARAAVQAPEERWVWAPGERIVAERAESGDALLDLAHQAKERFGADLAYVTLVNGDRQHYLANTAPGSGDVPLELSHCKVTIAGDEVVVVQNSFKDERFRNSPLLDLTQLRFYAGVPLKNEQGENVGTFCVSSVLPRSAASVPEAALREYAAAAEAELARLAAASPSTADTPA